MDEELREKLAALICQECDGVSHADRCELDESICPVLKEMPEKVESLFRAAGYRKLEGEPPDNSLRTFTAYRRLDISATHDENQRNAPSEPQYEGVVFTDGICVIRWLTAKRSVSVWNSFEDMFAIHGHPEYGTEIVWHEADMKWAKGMNLHYLHRVKEHGKTD